LQGNKPADTEKWYWQVFFFSLPFTYKLQDMKKIYFLLLIAVGSAGYSQQCGNYFFLQSNKTIEMSISNKKGKDVGKLIYVISDVATKGSVTTGTVNSEFIDKNGKSVSKATNSIQCENGNLMMDMKMFIPSAQMEQMGDISATGAASYLEYPSVLKEGDALKDASFSMDFKSASGLGGHISIDMTNRKGQGKESVTTPAGTWDCYKITYHSKMIFKMGIGIPMNADVTEWFAPGFGVVKTESSNGTTQITSIK